MKASSVCLQRDLVRNGRTLRFLPFCGVAGLRGFFSTVFARTLFQTRLGPCARNCLKLPGLCSNLFETPRTPPLEQCLQSPESGGIGLRGVPSRKWFHGFLGEFGLGGQGRRAALEVARRCSKVLETARSRSKLKGPRPAAREANLARPRILWPTRPCGGHAGIWSPPRRVCKNRKF